MEIGDLPSPTAHCNPVRAEQSGPRAEAPAEHSGPPRRFPQSEDKMRRPTSAPACLFQGLRAVDAPPAARNASRMSWETPSFVEINMNAEIGGYNPDFDDREPNEPVVSEEVQPSGSALER
jgi:hypothetical protein